MVLLKPLSILLLLVSLIGCSVASGQKTAGEFLDDSVITTRVKTALVADTEVRAGEISVETYKGVVQLSGFVSSRASAERAVRVARGVPGVRGVNNDMRLRQ